MIVFRSFWILGQVPSLNDVLAMDPFTYNSTKKKWAKKVKLAVEQADVPAFKSARIWYDFHEKTKRRDPSNFIGTGMKFIEDALVGLAVLPDDGWDEVLQITPRWRRSPDAGVRVMLHGEIYDEPRERIQERKLREAHAKKLGRKKPARAGAVGLKRNPRPLGKAVPAKARRRAGVPARKRKG